MSRFNLADYETVAQRITRFYTDHPDGRIHTDLLHALDDSQGWRFVVRASIYVGEELKATGLAEERLNGKGANQDAALENAETSAIGRALANWKYSGAKRASREEMGKAGRYASAPAKARQEAPVAVAEPAVVGEWAQMLADATTTAEVEAVADHMRAAGAPDNLLEAARTRWAEVA
jgi:hypothetical protein